jgi:fructose-bisphosphate aldolase class I
MPDLHETRTLVAGHKGILAADEANASITTRFASIGVESTEATRQAYRDALFTTPGLDEFISGVILFDETIRQRALDGTTFPELLLARGILPGIKADIGAVPLPFAPGETVTEGLDGLRSRLDEYRSLGARFAKWRAPLALGAGLPSDYAIHANAHALARYAAISQEAGLV